MLLEMQSLWVRLGIVTAQLSFPTMATNLVLPPAAQLAAQQAALLADISDIKSELLQQYTTIAHDGTYKSVVRQSTNNRLISGALGTVVPMRLLRGFDMSKPYFVQLEVGDSDPARARDVAR